MQSISLKDLQLKQLELLKIVHAICEENNLQYWIDGGTLLGSVRHRGYIPWDDDLDICLLKNDFDKLLPLIYDYCKNHKSLQLFYYNQENHLNWSEFFGNLQVLLKRPNGKGFFPCHIDIFPIKKVKDTIDSINYDREITDICNYYVRGLVKYPELFDRNIIEKSKKESLKSKQNFMLEYNKYLDSNMHNNNESSLYTYSSGDSLSNRRREYYTYSDIFPLKEVLFEGFTFWGPQDTHSYLTKLYGDYSKLPSIEFQKPYNSGFYKLKYPIKREKLDNILNRYNLLFHSKNNVMFAIKRFIYYLLHLKIKELIDFSKVFLKQRFG